MSYFEIWFVDGKENCTPVSRNFNFHGWHVAEASICESP